MISWTEPADTGEGDDHRLRASLQHGRLDLGTTGYSFTGQYQLRPGIWAGPPTWYVQVRAVTDAAHTRGIPQRHPPPADYDADNDGLIEIDSLARLNAVRWDLDGDGTPAAGNETGYAAAFPDAPFLMGCPSGCTGYELTGDLEFGTWDANNAYWNGGSGWDPIGDDTEPLHRHLRRRRPHHRQPVHQPDVSQPGRPVRGNRRRERGAATST